MKATPYREHISTTHLQSYRYLRKATNFKSTKQNFTVNANMLCTDFHLENEKLKSGLLLLIPSKHLYHACNSDLRQQCHS